MVNPGSVTEDASGDEALRQPKAAGRIEGGFLVADFRSDQVLNLKSQIHNLKSP
jgi:hypothetical protein